MDFCDGKIQVGLSVLVTGLLHSADDDVWFHGSDNVPAGKESHSIMIPPKKVPEAGGRRRVKPLRGCFWQGLQLTVMPSA
jgi:hypothetical protein